MITDTTIQDDSYHDRLFGKRLLVLGGSAWCDAIRDFCDHHGVTMVAAGRNPDAKYCKVAEEYYQIELTDVLAMKELITGRAIDGVYLGASEEVIPVACEYLAELGMPCYCTKQQWDILMNKIRFKELCERFGIPVARRYQYSPGDACTFDFPVITKPSDGCASVGITVCNNEAELLEGFRFASSSSRSGEVLVEQLVNNAGMDVFFQITDGEVEFVALGDKYPVQLAVGAGSVAGARIIPSIYTDEFRSRFEQKIVAMFRSIGLTQGLIWMEVFHDGDEYYFNEVGYRMNGSLSMYGIDYLCGINPIAADVFYALTGKGKARGFDSLIPRRCARGKKNVCEYWIAVRHGRIGEIEGIERVRSIETVLACVPKYQVGDTVPHTNGFAQNFCVTHIAYDVPDELEDVIHSIDRFIAVRDGDGQDMIIHKNQDFTKGILTRS